VEIAEHFGMPIVVRSSFSDTPGTRIVNQDSVEVETMRSVRAVAHDTDVGQITVRGARDHARLAHALFQPLADHAINVDVIVQNTPEGGLIDISFTVGRSDLESALELVRPVAEEIGAREVLASSDLAKVSVVGVGIQSTPGIASRTFGALADAGIDIEGITTSEIRITCLVAAGQVKRAAQALHEAFALRTPDEG
jgi:aspartate kinase